MYYVPYVNEKCILECINYDYVQKKGEEMHTK